MFFKYTWIFFRFFYDSYYHHFMKIYYLINLFLNFIDAFYVSFLLKEKHLLLLYKLLILIYSSLWFSSLKNIAQFNLELVSIQNHTNNWCKSSEMILYEYVTHSKRLVFAVGFQWRVHKGDEQGLAQRPLLLLAVWRIPDRTTLRSQRRASLLH